jgi:hypothetical protein
MELGGGKYTLVWDEPGGRQRALRYGEEWRELTGDNLIATMRECILDLSREVDRLRASKDEVKIDALEEREGLIVMARNQIAAAEQALELERRGRAEDSARWNERIKLLEARSHRAHSVLLGAEDRDLDLPA